MKNLLLLFCIFALSFEVSAQIETPQPSPFTKIEQKVGLTDVTLEYSRPGMRGREIFGELVPFGEIWRTGANANTVITFAHDVEISGQTLKAGSYAIYTIPNLKSWDVIFYSETNNWGVPENWDETNIELTANAEVSELPFPMETFTIFIDDLKNDSAVLNFVWGTTVASLPIEFPTDDITMASIERVMNGPTANDYFAAASYFHDSGKDNKKALEWINKAVEIESLRALT